MSELCPRCGVRSYTPYGTGAVPTERAPFPALSRMDNRTYVCSWCGTDEAMRDFHGEPPLAPDQWPIIQPGSFGVGRL